MHTTTEMGMVLEKWVRFATNSDINLFFSHVTFADGKMDVDRWQHV